MAAVQRRVIVLLNSRRGHPSSPPPPKKNRKAKKGNVALLQNALILHFRIETRSLKGEIQGQAKI